MAAADSRILVNAVLAVGHAVIDDAAVMLHAPTVHAGELAKRPLVMHPALGGHDLSLQDDLSIGRNLDIIRLTLHYLRRGAIEAAQHLQVVGIRGYPHQRGHLVEGRTTNDNSDGQVLTFGTGLRDYSGKWSKRAQEGQDLARESGEGDER